MTEKDDLPSLDSLAARIADAREKTQPERKAEAGQPSGKAVAMRAISELIAGIAVGGFIGYHLDGWLESRPIGIVLGILLGMAGGIMNIYRAASSEAAQQSDDAAMESLHSRDNDGT